MYFKFFNFSFIFNIFIFILLLIIIKKTLNWYVVELLLII